MRKEYSFYVYIACNKRNNVLYIGVTKSLMKRMYEHREGMHKNSFTEKYKINKLVHYESYGDIRDAIEREKVLKKWNREWKIKLIEKDNEAWRDLYLEMVED